MTEQQSSKDKEASLLAARFVAAKKSLVAFRTYLLPAKNDCAPAPMHHRWSDIILNGTKNFAVEAARDTAKTQIVLRANLLHALVFPTEKRSYIAIIRATKDLAANLLINISREYLSRPEFYTQPEGKIEVVANSGDALEVHYPNGRRVRIESYGKGGAIRGIVWGAKRPDLVVCDDLQSLSDSQSEALLESDWNWFLSDIKFLGAECRIFMIGNNLGEKCIIERVLRNPELCGFEVERCPILDEEGNSTWPSRFSVKKIMQEKEDYARLGKADIWYREKLCQCRSPDSQLFKPEYFRYYNPATLSTNRMTVFMAVDPAASKKSSADYSVNIVVGLNEEGHWFVLDCWYGRKSPTEHMDEIFRMVSKWNPITVGIEKVAYQAALGDFLKKEMPRRNIFFTVTDLAAAGKKEIRIETLQPRFAAGSVWFPQGAAWVPEMESQLLAFPTGIHDDLPDALAYIEQIALPPPKRRRYSNIKMPKAGRIH